ncbi:hypothetical protein ACWD5Q_08195 [Streptomyces sp. NPDC002513]
MPRASMTAIPALPVHFTRTPLVYLALRRRFISGLTTSSGRG